MGIFTDAYLIMNRAVKWITGVITGANDEEKIRKIKSSIRHNKKSIHDLQRKNAKLAKSVIERKKSNEYLRRGIITNYYQEQINLIDSIINVIKELQNQSYAKIKNIENNLCSNKALTIPKEYWELNTQLHNEIKNSKQIKAELIKKKLELIDLTKTLVVPDYENYRKHGKLGSKKLLAEIIDVRNSELINEYCNKQIIKIGEYAFSLDTKCKTCGSFVSGLLHYCFVCGSELNKEAYYKFSRKDVQEFNCPECYCPMLGNWNYCPNCGFEYDPLYLKKVL